VYFDLANVLVFLGVGMAFIFVNLTVSWLLRPKGPSGPGKLAIYECGEPTVGQAWVRFDIRFYTVALMFVVFDIEIALLFPWAAVFRDLVAEGLGWVAFLEVMTFLVILMSGLFYVWARRDLEWTGPASAAANVLPDSALPSVESPAHAAPRGEALGARR
jgi:NADH-quinone oxidoreductase subunit A